MEASLCLRAQRAQDAAGCKQRGAQPLGERAKRCASAEGTRLGHAIEIIGGDQLGVHGEGDGRCDIELSDLAPHIPGDKLDGGSHFGHDTLGFVDALHATLAETFLLGHSANGVDMPLHVSSNESAVSTHAALKIDKMVVVANAPDMLLDLFALRSETRVLTTGCFERVLSLLQTHGVFGGT